LGQSDQEPSLAGADFEHGTLQGQRLRKDKSDAGLQVAAESPQMGVTFEHSLMIGEHIAAMQGWLHAPDNTSIQSSCRQTRRALPRFNRTCQIFVVQQSGNSRNSPASSA
jgi:hypothetical protein